MTPSDQGVAASSSDNQIDMRRAVRSTLGSVLFAGLVTGGIYLIARIADELDGGLGEPDNEAAPPVADAEAAAMGEVVSGENHEAAVQLGVPLDATADQIRAALRSKLAGSRIHPDHGGDGDEAKRLIAAKNYLIDRLRQENQP
jgi:hypothetical protein